MPMLRARRTRVAAALADAVTVGVAVPLAGLLVLDLDAGAATSGWMIAFAVGGAVLHVVAGVVVGTYRTGHTLSSREEALDLTITLAVTTLGLLALNAVVDPTPVPRSVPLTAAVLALVGMLATRFVFLAARSRQAGPGTSTPRAVVLGAGEGGRQLVRALTRDPAAPLAPVALLDDDPGKRRLRIDGIRVRGSRADLARVVDELEATHLVVAIPSAGYDLMREVREAAAANDLEVLVLPTPREILGGVGTSDLRSLDVRDLLGRRPIELDHDEIARSIRGRSVLVTGAGGSIGAELCRQISRYDPSRLYMLDRDESALHATQVSLTGRGLLDDDSVVLADIRDAERMHEVFQEVRPDVVFHAAALKHLPLLERYPMEAWKTNVLGTLNVLDAARATQVATFVNVSTDKAANPTCVLGYSKRLTERFTADAAAHDEGTYVSVRFGNVLGSRGSVITAFTAQIEQGGPVTVTHPDVERYFMLIPEACQLVLQASAIGVDGEVMVLDMGTPAKIDEVARTLISLSGRTDVEIVHTGLRPGEKMSEELFTPGESIRETAHELISSVDVPAMDAEVARSTRHGSPAAAAAWMARTTTPRREDDPSLPGPTAAQMS